MKLSIARDTREKTPWEFEFYGAETIVQCLTTGDYSLVGYEDKICIERKASSGEIANNLRGVNKKRFVAELTRMDEFEYSYLICEFTLETLLKFPEGSGIPKRFWFKKGKNGKTVKNIKLSGKYILSFLENICNQNNIELIFCNGPEDANKVAFEILKDYAKLKE